MGYECFLHILGIQQGCYMSVLACGAFQLCLNLLKLSKMASGILNYTPADLVFVLMAEIADLTIAWPRQIAPLKFAGNASLPGLCTHAAYCMLQSFRCTVRFLC